MREDTIERLKKISKPRQFAKDDYICYEGQPGSEMYIILTGSVGIFITSSIGTLNQVATINAGGFFGEMAIFDNLPRSASCIALEDAICIAVTQENLQEFLATCPDIAKQMLENMSGRIRKLDGELYQNSRFVKNRFVPKFEIPFEYAYSHVVKEPYQDEKFLVHYKQACPICGKALSVTDVKRNIIQPRQVDLDCRITYLMCDPLWFEVMSCPHCHYTNHYLKFFGINNFEHEVVERILQEEQAPVIRGKDDVASDFDRLAYKYLQAIHINENINPGANALIGNLWRNLYWLSKDSLDMNFAKYCAKKAMEKYKVAIEENEIFDPTSKCSTALSLASLYAFCNMTGDIKPYVDIAVQCPDERIRKNALTVQGRLEQLLKKL